MSSEKGGFQCDLTEFSGLTKRGGAGYFFQVTQPPSAMVMAQSGKRGLCGRIKNAVVLFTAIALPARMP
ncbi:hypothetical protein CI610_03187 [invertebrate metagenome]|uniref:Uncharacterized protein n=1 Tax=invertebrate metagenome TaxID=1711999 RepID=A0A2H9T3S3_9ZZZZ